MKLLQEHLNPGDNCVRETNRVTNVNSLTHMRIA